MVLGSTPSVQLNQSIEMLVILIFNLLNRNDRGINTILQKYLLFVVISSGVQEVMSAIMIPNEMEEDFGVARVFVLPSELESH